jgi:polyisoprenoid-binding protein YceI
MRDGDEPDAHEAPDGHEADPGSDGLEGGEHTTDVTDDAAAPAEDGELAPTPSRGPRRLRWIAAGVGLVALGGGGLFAWRQVKPVLDARKYSTVTYEVPAAPKLTPGKGETVYRIDPTRSSLTYRVQERFAGRAASTATGVTNGLAGDVALDPKHPAAARFGRIVANVEQFHSDNNLRDARLRQDFLESHAHPLATFDLTDLRGLTGAAAPGKARRFQLVGTVTVKGIAAEATFDATATLKPGGTLVATATTTVKLSRFDAGPISIAGLVSTDDDVRLTLRLTLLDPARHTIPNRITGPHAKEPTGGPSFAATIQPILEASCASCHNDGAMGSRHVRIDTAGDAQAISDGLKTVTQLRYMPPWPASDKGVPLAHKTTLTQAQIDAIAAWADAGAPLDVDADTPIRPTEAAAQVIPRKDLVLTRPAYTGSIQNTNDYRCFLLKVDIDEPTYLTGYTFLADQVEELHHAQVFHVSAQQAARAPTQSADGQPGWKCYGGPGLRGPQPEAIPGRTSSRRSDIGFAGQDDLVAGWVPGQAPVIFPQHSGVLLHPGDALVLQLHYHYADAPTADRSSIALQLDPVSSGVKALRVVNPLGPVEIPCAPEDAGEPLCDREAALRDNARLYGPSGAANEGGLLMLCNTTPAELTKDFDGHTGRTTCDLQVPEDGTIIGVLGHMHTIGKSFRMTLDAGTPKEQILLDIPHWSFDWQMNYALAKPIHVTGGQPLRLECTWDRDLDPGRSPKYIVFAEGTEDEMCFGTYALIPDDQ